MSKKPEKLGKYKIVAELGEGSMGIVYKAIDPDIQEFVALKTLHKERSNNNQAIISERFINEVKTGRLLRHPNIVAIYDYQEEEDTRFLVMEYIEGDTLKNYLQNKKTPDIDQTLNIMSQLLQGLDAAHQQGVVHRDVKPENLMLRDNTDVLITDFGIAHTDRSTMTVGNSILGSPAYMSPEQCLGQTVDARSDLFSAGVILYQLLTGQKPFSGKAITDTMHQILHSQPASPSALNSTLATDWDNLINKALAKNADKRFQTASDFQQALNAIQKTKPSHALKWVISATLLALLAGAGFWWKTQPEQTPKAKQNLISLKSGGKLASDTILPSDLQLTQLLDKYACDVFKESIDSQNTINISGYISATREQAFREAIKRLVASKNTSINLNLTPIIDRNCEALNIIQPFVLNNQSQKHALKVQAYQHSPVFIEGERPVFEVMTPDFPGYIYVDYYMADGNVFHLLPTTDKPQEEVLSRQWILIGNYGITRQWQIVEPYGKEIISVITSDRPLFARGRDDIEESKNYLLELRLALFEIENAVIVADNYIISTISQAEAENMTNQ